MVKCNIQIAGAAIFLGPNVKCVTTSDYEAMNPCLAVCLYQETLIQSTSHWEGLLPREVLCWTWCNLDMQHVQ